MKIIAANITNIKDRSRAINQLLRLQSAQERLLSPKIKKMFIKQLSETSKNISSRGNAASVLSVVDDIKSAELHKILTDHYESVFLSIGEPTYNTLVGKTKAERSIFDVSRDVFIRQHSAKRSISITETTKRIIRGILIEALSEGLGISAMAKLIIDEIDGIGFLNAKQRAFMIARTETHTASTVAMEAAVKASGFGVVREWATVIDGRQRESHEEVDGEKRYEGESFKVGNETMRFPGDPNASASNLVNCRCQTLYVRA